MVINDQSQISKGTKRTTLIIWATVTAAVSAATEKRRNAEHLILLYSHLSREKKQLISEIYLKTDPHEIRFIKKQNTAG